MKRKVTAEQIEDSLDRWSQVLASVRAATEEVPHGWLTSKQIAEQQSRPQTTVEAKLVALVKSGRVETQKFRIRTGQVIRPVTHYRLP